MENEVLAQANLAKLIKNCMINFRKSTSTSDRHGNVVKARLELLKGYWERYFNNHMSISALATEQEQEEHTYFTKDVFSEVEIVYTTQLGELNDMLAQSSNRAKSVSENTGQSREADTEVRLPRISVPQFSGRYIDWPEFRDLFTSVVINHSALNGVQRMHYLKTACQGDAAAVLGNMAVTSSNFEASWNSLIARYENDRIIAYSHFKELVALPQIIKESAADVKRLLDGTLFFIRALKSLKRPVDQWDDWLIYVTVQKFNASLRKQWESEISSSTDLPEFSVLENFLLRQLRSCECMESLSSSTSDRSSAKPQHKPNPKVHFIAKNDSCAFCTKNHFIGFCFAFKREPVHSRQAHVNKASLCENCLRLGHETSACPSIHSCRVCGKKHHSLLHQEVSTIAVANKEPKCGSHLSTRQGMVYERVLLATAFINVVSSTGNQSCVRALIDPGSQVTFISERLVQRLRLQKHRTNIPISGIGSTPAGTANSSVEFTLKSCVDKAFAASVQALVLKKLTGKLPFVNLTNINWSHLQDLILADTKYYESANIDVILGADIYGHIMLEGIRKGPPDTPIAQNSVLGWILSGPTNPNLNGALTFTATTCFTNVEVELLSQLRRFWEIEEPYQEIISHLSPEEKACEEFFQKTHVRDRNGRYIVQLPLLPSLKGAPLLGESRSIAVRRLMQLEHRFKNNSILRVRYLNFMNQYLDLKHMERVPDHERNVGDTYYLPHHGVTKENSTSTKLRVVFDGSQKSANGFSLNDRLCNGPKLQIDLSMLILKWRKLPIVFTADAEKTYRQIQVDAKSADLQRIVWRNSPEQQIQDFRLTTVTYGTKPAAYLAIKSLKQLALDEQLRFPIGAQVINEDFYVDDVLSGAEDVPAALEAQKQLLNIMESGGFKLKKWCSNSQKVLQSIPEDDRATNSTLNLYEHDTINTLGLLWHPACDDFRFSIYIIPAPHPITKRTLLADSSRLFDPLGWIAPVVICTKIIFQKLWLLQLSWDDPLPQHIIDEWLSHRNELKLLQDLRISRWLGITASCRYNLHAFCDASEAAYAAVLYVRVTTACGTVHCKLLTAKTKVAPLKKISLPRLELCGALLLSKLVSSVLKIVTSPDIKIFAWTDSTIVLHWLQGNPSQWKCFVANRVSEIQCTIPNAIWGHVPSIDNPADCASRGLSAKRIIDHDLWWSGPSWIILESKQWPSRQSSAKPEDFSNGDLEEKSSIVALSTISQKHWSLLDRYSSLSKLCRITAYIMRFIHNVRSKDARILLPLSYANTLDALDFWIRETQHEEFAEELKCLLTQNQIPRRSKILKLSPFLDTKGIMRVRGRLENASVSFSEKHPIIMPKRHRLTTLLIAEAHFITLHGGTQLTLSHLRRKFWICDGRNRVSSYIRNCVKCIRHRATTQHQIMASLPRAQVTPKRPFLHSGVDFAGPFMLKMTKGRGLKSTKGYLCIFVCFVTKACHLEVVSDMTTEAFISAFKRFVSRRGICSDLYSDRGTNFVGADADLKKRLHQCSKEHLELASSLASAGTTWHFNPPASPHFGGLWEAGVKSAKHHLKRVIGDTILTFEEMSTTVAQIEACLNSRPLSRLTGDPDDLAPLTPGHFLVGEPLLTIPEPNKLQTPINRLTRWQLTDQMVQHFWRRWSIEYLSQLHERQKWASPQKEIKVNDIVIIKDDRLPPARWALGRVTALHPGEDGRTRVVSLNSGGNSCKRPIVKLCRLPIGDVELQL